MEFVPHLLYVELLLFVYLNSYHVSLRHTLTVLNIIYISTF